MDLSMNEEIPAEEDISYEMSVKNKRYQASFTYIDGDRDPAVFIDSLVDYLSEFFSEVDRAMLKEELKRIIELPEEEREAAQAALIAKMQGISMGGTSEEEVDSGRAFRAMLTFLDGMKSLADGSVWFMIHEHYGRYNIGLYYDNLHNQAHGEDL